MSQLGQKRRFGDVRVTSVLPLKADIHRKSRHVSKVPTVDVAAFVNSIALFFKVQAFGYSAAAGLYGIPIF
jgi:hypothetical protein